MRASHDAWRSKVWTATSPPLDERLGVFDSAGAEHAEAIAAHADVHRRGAVNLVHDTALRQHDRREPQNDLMDLGVTSLATTEAHVQAKVLAGRNVLRALRRDTGPWGWEAVNEALDDGEKILSSNSDAFFTPEVSVASGASDQDRTPTCQ